MTKTIALYAHHFLEPTHYAIAQLLSGLYGYRFRVFAKRIHDNELTRSVKNVLSIQACVFGQSGPRLLSECSAVHAIYDGDLAFEAGGAAARARLPFLLSFHGGFDIHVILRRANLLGRSVLLANSATAITVVSESDRRFLASLGIVAPIELLPVPIDAQQLPMAFGGSCPGPVAVIGRLIEKKGIDIAIRALKLLDDSIRLTVIGDGPERRNLEDLATQLGVRKRVTFAGELPLREALDILSRHSVLVHASRRGSDGNSDGTPQIILWAQAIGVPVVATDTGSICEIVSASTGVLVPEDDSGAVAEAINAVSTNTTLRASVVAEARQRAYSRHSLENVAQQLSALYSSSIDVRGRPPVMQGLKRLYWGTLSHGERQRAQVDLANALAAVPFHISSVEFAAEGGQGLLFACFGPNDALAAAIKLPRTLPTAGPEKGRSISILREVRCLRALGGVGAPKLFSFDADGRYLIREFIVGSTLQSTIRSELSQEARRDLMLEVVHYGRTLMARAHSQSGGPFVLRDFKAENLIISFSHTPSLCQVDFGSVKPVETIRKQPPLPHRAGSKKWLHFPPEELFDLGADQRGIWADYFALGVAAFMTLFGESPYSNAISERTEAIRQYREEYSVAKARMLAPGIGMSDLDAAVVRFVAQCLDPDPVVRRELPDGTAVSPRA